jgi:hypothetical protein
MVWLYGTIVPVSIEPQTVRIFFEAGLTTSKKFVHFKEYRGYFGYENNLDFSRQPGEKSIKEPKKLVTRIRYISCYTPVTARLMLERCLLDAR